MLGIVSIKLLVLLLMLFITFVTSMLPLLFVQRIRRTADANTRSRYQSVLSLLSCFAGGVFLGTCILDLFPDTQAQIDKVLAKYPASARAFPVAEFIVVYGFLLVLTLEQLVVWCKERHLEQCPPATARLLSFPRHSSAHLEHSLSGVTDQPDLTASLRSNSSNVVVSYGAVDDHTGRALVDSDDNHGLEGITLHSPLRSLMLLFALSLHSVFEGLAVGLQATIDDVVALFLIVILHKGVIAFSLGLNMVQSRLALNQIVLSNVFFCITAPVGIGIGVGISSLQTSPTVALVAGMLQGLACGTFLYVTFFEVLPHEMNSGHQRLTKNVFVIAGFAAVCAMMFIEPSQKTPTEGVQVTAPWDDGRYPGEAPLTQLLV